MTYGRWEKRPRKLIPLPEKPKPLTGMAALQDLNSRATVSETYVAICERRAMVDKGLLQPLHGIVANRF